MLFKTIKNTTSSIAVLAICIMSITILALSFEEHEKLYFEFVKGDLDALSENMSSDLIPLLAVQPDVFELTTMLLRLDKYENVKFAAIYDKNWQSLQSYHGKSSSIQHPITTFQLETFKKKVSGVYSANSELIAVKLIGDKRLPLGFLLIIHDPMGPLSKSKLSLLKQVLPLTLTLLVIIIVLLFWIQGRLFYPLISLSRLTQKIRRTNDYSLKINIRGKQEVASLSQDLNLMMETINQETKKNKEYTNMLMNQQKAMERLANFDALTGLPNRQFFMETLRIELAKAQRTQKNLVLMYFDLDGFKGVNDSLGHDTGDQLLIEVSKRAKEFFRDGDIISRLGGDEFLILLHNEPNDFLLFQIAERLVNGLAIPFEINSWEVQVSVSVGIAKAFDANFNLSEFVSNADVAMYRSKMAGRDTHTVFVPEMMEDNKRRLLISNSISHAIKNNEFMLFYQPKVSSEEVIVGYEALIRWNSDELGMVSPVEFIPIAEQSGKIQMITKWVLERLCMDIGKIQDSVNPDIIISVNLSAQDIKNKAQISYVKELFTQYDVDPTAIEFEVTESAYLENFDMANDFFTEMKQLGSSIALDDFGTGYSSLSYLTQLQLNTLKIDKQFVDNILISKSSTLITKTIIEMAKQLNLKICAEGVETREQFDFLVAHGCHQLQGYLFSKPISLEQILSDNLRN
ncbi:EAL domain-containing protein [Colwellia sp. Arc7-635]|uniref:putative bifunctional diguanylate cyclase/phosphodiesterase n=1 Tax=Colwellia sp. Arc7-635 TaxID=2497879 RepID=UPI000F857E13|nr:EAL domain-containing protein [Colwellia sp. Arc7-635]AZQ84490.1 EAL domain-containing protein [Colwellia sp. Arc7-635]